MRGNGSGPPDPYRCESCGHHLMVHQMRLLPPEFPGAQQLIDTKSLTKCPTAPYCKWPRGRAA